jgi:hypothetical protein
MFLAQNLILMGIFFTVPLCLQIVQGFDAFETGLRMLPVSVAMLVTAAAGSALASRWSPRTIVRAGLSLLVVAVTAARPAGFSTRRNSSAPRSAPLIGAVLITGLVGAFTQNVADNPAISAEASEEVGIRVQGQVSFVSADQVETTAADAGLDDAEVDEVVSGYEDAQLNALKTALLFAGFIVVASLAGTRNLPARRLDELAAPGAAPPPDAGGGQSSLSPR